MDMTLAASGGTNAGDIIVGVVVIALSFALYWVPSFVAYRRGVRNLGSVIVLNFFAFTVILWIVALAMALADPRAEPPPAAPPQWQVRGR